MGSTQSAEIKREVAELAPTSSSENGSDNMWVSLDEAQASYDDNSDSDDEDDEGLEERLRILKDAQKLKMMADFFLHPEKPVKSNPTAAARCYFERASAPQHISMEEINEEIKIQKDAVALKKLAVDFMHPEIPVKSSIACSRCYYERASAPQQEDDGEQEEEERARILADMKALKRAAYDYLHPEEPVATDATAFGRNYFSRYSASHYLTEDEAVERELVLKDARHLSEVARNAPIKVEPTTFGRNFFDRVSAPEWTTIEEEQERQQILNEARTLKKLAVWYRHPEMPLEVDATACGRNYFTRASALQEDDYSDEYAMILKDAAALKQKAVDFMHPELPVQTNPVVFGRNYFSRFSAPEQEEDDYANEHAMILKDAAALKQKAVDFMHPELPVQSNPVVFGRNYYSRFSAPEYEDDEYASMHEQVHMDAAKLYHLAVDYLHPEREVKVDPAAFGRNYFNRQSATEQEEEDYAEERAKVLMDAAMLKEKAVDFMHPELPVRATDPTIFGRNYFSRPAAYLDEDSDIESEGEEERELILSDAHRLERLAMNYHHPEQPVQTKEEMEIARNYYEPKYHHHHVHYDMEDDVHLHHVEFDRNVDHHHEITQVRVTSPTAAPRKAVKNFDLHLPMSPGCVMTLSNPSVSEMPELPMSPECVMSFAHPASEHWHPELPSLS